MTNSVSASGIAAHITVIDGQPTTTTQDIADVYGKRHDRVMAIVRQRMTEAGEWGVHNFVDTPYTNPQNCQTYPVIRMTKKGFHFVVGKFTGARAVQHQIAFADEFERMEAELSKPTRPAMVITQKPSEDQMREALNMGLVMAGYVQQAVAKAVLRGSDDWKHKRWLVSFAPDKGSVRTPVVDALAFDTVVLPKAEVIDMMADISAAAWIRMRHKLELLVPSEPPKGA